MHAHTRVRDTRVAYRVGEKVAVVNSFGRVLYDKYVAPRERVTDYRTAVSGVTRQLLQGGSLLLFFLLFAERCSAEIRTSTERSCRVD